MGELIERAEPRKSTAVTAQQDTAARLIEVALQSNADIEKLERLLVLQQKWQAEQARMAFFDALSGFQSNLPPIKKMKKASFPTRNGGRMEYSYASLDDVAEAIRPLLAQYGLAYRFEQKFDVGGMVWVKCILSHSAGHSEECSMPAFADDSGQKSAIQQVASTITYLRRYTLTGVLGIATTDQDLDGADAGDNQNSEQQKQEQQPQQPPQENYYPDAQFNKHFPKWKEAIESGVKTRAAVIATVESKYLLTGEQMKQLNNVKEPTK